MKKVSFDEHLKQFATILDWCQKAGQACSMRESTACSETAEYHLAHYSDSVGAITRRESLTHCPSSTQDDGAMHSATQSKPTIKSFNRSSLMVELTPLSFNWHVAPHDYPVQPETLNFQVLVWSPAFNITVLTRSCQPWSCSRFRCFNIPFVTCLQ